MLVLHVRPTLEEPEPETEGFGNPILKFCSFLKLNCSQKAWISGFFHTRWLACKDLPQFWSLISAELTMAITTPSSNVTVLIMSFATLPYCNLDSSDSLKLCSYVL
ncbi:uncharacterized protein LOC133719782 isoform X1 [Rosa rugosa]|uniref:uncharacterized protein LOC133719782 isoform X1 n=1 Tax=Rosa rugosa TaxID=74645 RepID=UPI002B407497|nr:uncharacterized protein LOC133719782 isoform X1 [Rosa rugosa]